MNSEMTAAVVAIVTFFIATFVSFLNNDKYKWDNESE